MIQGLITLAASLNRWQSRDGGASETSPTAVVLSSPFVSFVAFRPTEMI